MKKVILNNTLIDEFIKWRSQGVSIKRISSILLIHHNTLYLWIKKGKEIFDSVNGNLEELDISLFNKDEIVLNGNAEYCLKLYLENKKQYNIAIANSEIRAIKTANPNHFLMASLLEVNKNSVGNLSDKNPNLLENNEIKKIVSSA